MMQCCPEPKAGPKSFWCFMEIVQYPTNNLILPCFEYNYMRFCTCHRRADSTFSSIPHITSLGVLSEDESLEAEERWSPESPLALEPALLSGVMVSGKSYSSCGTTIVICSTDITPSSSSLPWLP
ncbi:hypothetical protein SLEP1_g58295 [Rubroshorea leprosula]|uniref:Uncharacterized protein n=1 Tax=Rubroshorea leprosula TaxID=152421 RepID=A0AAV5MS50_9ROSI|nr:hypothetical protein SLEP1_g58295 [Rubroshorea leprosula]